jgi:hypothetical protein
MCTGTSSLEQLQSGLAELVTADVVGESDEQVRAEVLGLLACLNQLTAALAERIGSFDVRALASADAVHSTMSWLRIYGRMSKGAAMAWMSRARLLRELPELAQAMREGEVSAEQLAKVAELAARVGVQRLKGGLDEALAQLAAQAGPAEVSHACARILAHLDPDGAEPDPASDLERRELTFYRCGSMVQVKGRLDAESAAALQSAVDAVMRPPAPDDDRTAGQRRVDALADIARLVLHGGALPQVGGERPHVAVLLTPQDLLGSQRPAAPCPVHPAGADPHGDGGCPQGTPGSTGPDDGTPRLACTCDALSRAGVPRLPDRPWLNWVGPISPETAQRLACDATVWRLVLDPTSGLPLDVGRQVRIVPTWMRKAVAARDRTCRWPGCDVRAEWCDVHHEVPWYEGGPTAVHLSISLCRRHHGLVHEGRWRLHHDHESGIVSVTRPDGRPYDVAPSRPFVSPTRQAPPTPTPTPTTSTRAAPRPTVHPRGSPQGTPRRPAA